MSSTAAAPPASGGSLTHRQIVTILIGLMAGMFLAALDQTIVASAIRVIGDDLNGLTVQAWVTTAYLITSTITTPLYGKLSDIYGRRPFFLLAIVLFIIGSFASAFSTSMYMLAAFRAFQGLGAGGLFSLALTILGDIVPPRQRAKYQGYFLAVFGTSSVLGPVIGGFFAGQSSILGITGWRWVFLVNVPIGAVALLIVYRVLHIPHISRAHRIDWQGAVALVICLVPLLTVAEQGRTWGWGSGRSLACYVIGALGLVLFLLAERRIGEDALISLRFFRNQTFVIVTVVNVLVGAAMFGGIALLPLYLQIVKGASPTKSGLLLLPFTAGIMVGSIISGQLIARTGRYKVYPIVGLALLALAMGGMFTIGADTSLGWTDTLMLVFGLGLGGVMQPTVLAIQNAMPPRDIGVSTSSATFFRQIGATLGTAVFLSVLYSTVVGKLESAFRAAAGTSAFQAAAADPTIANAPANRTLLGFAKLAQSGTTPTTGGANAALNDTAFLKTANQTLAHPFYVGFSKSMDLVFVIGACLLVVAFVVIWFLREVPLRTQSGLEAQASEDAREAAVTDSAAGAAVAIADSPATAEIPATDRSPEKVSEIPAPTEPAQALSIRPAQAPEPASATGPAPAPESEPDMLYGLAHVNGATAPVETAGAGMRGDSSGSVVTGRILHGDQSPLRGASLTLTDLAGRAVAVDHSDAGGRYRLVAPAGGTFLVICVASGFQPLAATVTISATEVTRDLTLARASTVTGRVTGFQGEPVPGASVAMTDVRGQVVAAVQTDHDGAYAISDLYAGEYTLLVTTAHHQPEVRSVTVTTGTPASCDVILAGIGSIAGTITAATSGAPVAEATVTLIDFEGAVVATVLTDGAGAFRLEELRMGDYTITATGYAPAVAGVRVPNGELGGVDLTLRTAAVQAVDEHVEGRHAARGPQPMPAPIIGSAAAAPAAAATPVAPSPAKSPVAAGG